MSPQDASPATATNGATAVPQEVKIIPVSGKNPEVVEKLASLPKPQVLMEEVDFHFKTPRSDKKNADGKPVDDLGNVLTKRPTLKLALPVPTFDGLVEFLSDQKGQEFVLDLLKEAVINEARAQIADESLKIEDQSGLDLQRLTLNFLANQPKSERRGGGISKEVWEDFQKDYINVMPGVTGKSAEAIGNAAKLLMAKFQPVKTQKNVITLLLQQLSLWFSNTPNAEEFAECFEALEKRGKDLLAADESALLANL